MSDRQITPGSEISPDAHVGAEFEQVPDDVHAEPSEANPDALVEGNRVAVAEDME